MLCCTLVLASCAGVERRCERMSERWRDCGHNAHSRLCDWVMENREPEEVMDCLEQFTPQRCSDQLDPGVLLPGRNDCW